MKRTRIADSVIRLEVRWVKRAALGCALAWACGPAWAAEIATSEAVTPEVTQAPAPPAEVVPPPSEPVPPVPEVPVKPLPPPRRPYEPPRMAQSFRLTTNAVQSAVSAGLNLSRGNTEATSVQLGLQLYGDRDSIFWEWISDFSYAESRDTRVDGSRTSRTSDQGSTALSGRRRFGAAWYNAAELLARYDQLAGIDRRVVASVGIGRILAEDENYQLTIEAGVAQVMERMDGVNDNWPALRFAQRYEHRLPSRGLFREYVEWLPNPLDSGEYFVNADASLELPVWGRLMLAVGVRERYVSQPPESTKPNDIQFNTQFKWFF